MLVQGGPLQNFDVNAMEARLVRLDRRRIYIAFAVVILIHASTVVGFSFWTPAELPSPPGEMVITVDLAPAMAAEAADASPGISSEASQPQDTPPEPTPEEEVVEQEPPPPETAVEPVKEEVVQQEPTPAPETVQENVEPPPPAETAQVILAPKSVKPKPKPKPKPKAPAQPQAATSAATQSAEVAGSGAKASPNELNKYSGRVRAAIERKKFKPAAANGIGGGTFVSFTISRSGGVSGLRIAKSSGNAALDAAARASVTRASLPPIPAGLPSTISIGVPITFDP